MKIFDGDEKVTDAEIAGKKKLLWVNAPFRPPIYERRIRVKVARALTETAASTYRLVDGPRSIDISVRVPAGPGGVAIIALTGKWV